MRNMRLILMALAVLGMATAASAQVASSPGAVTGAEQKLLTGYDGSGFFLRSSDEEFALQLATRLQFQHRYEKNSVTGAKTNSFLMRRARFAFLGKMFRRFEFSMIVQYGSAGSPTTAVSGCAGCTVPNSNTFAWYPDMTVAVIPQFNVTVGAVTLPFDRLGESSSAKFSFNEVPITATQRDFVAGATIARLPFGADDDLGIRLWGDIAKFHYIVGVTNGFDANYFNSDTTFSYGARVWYDILGTPHGGMSDQPYSETPILSMGLGAMYDPEDATSSDTAAVIDRSLSGAADILFQWKGLSFISEFYGRKTKVKSGASAGLTLDDFGYYAQVGYFVIPKKLEIAARAAQIFREGPSNDAFEFGGGINYYIRGNNAKLQIDAFRTRDFNDVDSPSAASRKLTKVRTMLTFNI